MKTNKATIFFGLLIILLSIFDLRDAYRFSEVSEATEAIISSYKVKSASTGGRRWIGRSGGIDFQISYLFSINGQNYHGTDTVRSLPASNNITVLYNPNNPNQNKIKKPVRITGWFLLGLGILCVAVFSGAVELLRRKGSRSGNEPPLPKHEMRSEDEIRKDVRAFAEKNPLRGGLHLLDPESADDKHAIRRFQAREAMQPSELAPAGPIVKEWGYCRNHPFVKTNWRCADCGREFCEGCVTPLRHSMSHRSRYAVCPECKGRCIDFKYIENLANERLKEEKSERKVAIKLLLGISVVAAVAVPLFLLKVPIELQIVILVAIIGILWITRLFWHADRWFGFGRLVILNTPKQYHVHPAILIALGIIVILVVLLLQHFPSWGLK